MTETALKVIAALAIIGLRSTPKNGYRTPAATKFTVLNASHGGTVWALHLTESTISDRLDDIVAWSAHADDTASAYHQ